KEFRMNRFSCWLAIAALVSAVGCQQSEKGGSEPATSSASSANSAGAPGSSHTESSATATTTSTTASGMSTTATATTQAPAEASKEVTMPSGLKYQDVVVGTGAEAKSGMTVSVAYTGTFTNGEKFDSSVGKPPYTFVLGTHAVIAGWDQGIAGMKVGGKRKLTI